MFYALALFSTLIPRRFSQTSPFRMCCRLSLPGGAVDAQIFVCISVLSVSAY